MRKIVSILRVLSILLVLLCCYSPEAFSGEITGLRIGHGSDTVRVVFDSSTEFDYNVFLLSGPKRLVIDTDNIVVPKSLEKVRDSNNIVGHVRVGKLDGAKNRIVFDLLKPVIIKKAFMLAPQSTFKWRLAIDIKVSNDNEFNSKVGHKFAFSNGKNITTSSNSASSSKVVNKKEEKKIIVIDAGHGGHDPGAIGYSGVYEKNITLATAKELKRQLDALKKYKVYLTRSTDVFIPLRQRVKIARKHNADLFISIHADSAKNRKATGLSIYTLSEKASDKEAEALAERENQADIILGLDMGDQSKEVSEVLISLAQGETRNRSSEFAAAVVREMKKSVKTISDTHRFAGFAVLKAPDVPSVLLEMGYLSNKNEERLLKQPNYRKKLATSTVKAINRYFEDMKHKSLF